MINLQALNIKDSTTWNKVNPYPIGFVYMSTKNTSPASIYGGTWTPISGGKYLRANATYASGGSNTITVNQMPSHNHKPAFKGSWEESSTSYGLPTGGAFSGRPLVNNGGDGHSSGWGSLRDDNNGTIIGKTGGGGNPSIQHIKMYTVGTEWLNLSKEGVA